MPVTLRSMGKPAEYYLAECRLQNTLRVNRLHFHDDSTIVANVDLPCGGLHGVNDFDAEFAQELCFVLISRVGISAAHVLAGAARKTHEVFMMRFQLLSKSAHEPLRAGSIDVKLFPRLDRSRVSPRRPELLRRAYTFRFDIGNGAYTGSAQLYFEFDVSACRGDSARPLAGTYSARQLLPFRSPFLEQYVDVDVCEAIQWQADASQQSLTADFRMASTYQSATDSGGFHLTGNKALQMLQYACKTCLAQYRADDAPHRFSSKWIDMVFRRPIREVHRIRLNVRLLEEEAKGCRFSFDFQNGRFQGQAGGNW